MAIVLYHAKQIFNPLHSLPDEIVYSQGVSFFFILSGFILTYVYKQLSSSKEVALYLARRIARLWPLHLTIMMLSIAIVPRAMLIPPGTYPEWLVFLANFFMLQAWIPDLQFFFAYNAPSWSISSEIFFYLLLPALLLLSRYGKFYPLAIAVFFTTVLISAGNLFSIPEWSANGLSLQGILAIHPLARLTEFAAGMTAAHVFKALAGKFKPNKVIASLLEVAILGISIAAVLYSKPIAQGLSNFPMVGEAGNYWLTESGVPLIPFTLLILLFAFQMGGVSKILSIKPFVMLGEISFAVYLLHYPLIKYHSYYLPQERSLTPLLIFVAVLLIASHLLYKFVEVPARKYMTIAFSKLILQDSKPFFEESPMERLSNLRVYIAENASRIMGTGIEFAALGTLIILAHPGLNTISGAEAMNRMESSYCRVKNVRAGKDLEIKSITAHQTREKTTIELVLRSMSDATIDHFLSVQLLDDSGKEKYLQVTRLAPADIKVSRGKLWTSVIEIPEGTDMKDASRLGLIVARKEFITLEGGHTDMNGKRLLVPLDQMVSFSSKDEDEQL